MAGGRKKRRNRRKPADSPTPPPTPQIETKSKYVPPQPQQRYRDPDESIEMSDLSSNESMANLSSDSTTPHHPMTGSPPTLVNATFSPLNDPSPNVMPSQTQDNMETDDVETQLSEDRPTAQSIEDQHPSKRKRTNTNPDDSGRKPPTRQFTPLLSSPLNGQHDNPTTTLSLLPGTGPASNTPSSTVSTPPPQSTLDLTPIYTSTPRTSTRTQPVAMPRPNPSPFRADFIIPNMNVTGFIGDTPLLGLDPVAIQNWIDTPEPKALLYPHDAAFSEEKKGEIAQNMEEVIAKLLDCITPFTVTAPTICKSRENRKADNRRPWVYLLSGLSRTHTDRLIDMGFAPDPLESFHIIPFNPLPSHYVGRIRNIALDANHQQTVTDLIQRTIRDNAVIMSYISDFVSTHNDLIPDLVVESRNATEWIVRSVRAYHRQNDNKVGKAHTHWNWYIFSPTRDQARVTEWTQKFQPLRFNAKVHGIGETFMDTVCTRCKSTNHTNAECPFESPYIQPYQRGQPGGSRGRRGGKRGTPRGGARGRNPR